MARFLLALALFLVSADALVMQPALARAVRSPVSARVAVAKMGVEEAAQDCLESGCAIDEVSFLIDELESASATYPAQQKAQALAMVKKLKALSANSNVVEIEKLVAAMGRSFGTVDAFSFPGAPLGYTGKVGTTTTAGDSLDY